MRSLTDRLRGGGAALGAFLSVDSPDIAELLGLVGYDFIQLLIPAVATPFYFATAENRWAKMRLAR